VVFKSKIQSRQHRHLTESFIKIPPALSSSSSYPQILAINYFLYKATKIFFVKTFVAFLFAQQPSP